MAYRILWIIFLYFQISVGIAGDIQDFIKDCQKSAKLKDPEIQYLQKHFRTSSCKKIAKKISHEDKFASFFPPAPYQVLDGTESSWKYEVKELDAPRSEYSRNQFTAKYEYIEKAQQASALFKDPRRYSAFTNLKILDFTSGNFSASPCEILKGLPHLKTIVTEGLLLKDLVECKDNVPDIIVLGQYTNLHEGVFEDKIIGIEFASPEELNRYPYKRLRYLGFIALVENGDLDVVLLRPNITHFTLIATQPVIAPNILGYFSNLSFLGLSCLRLFSYYSYKEHAQECEKPPIEDYSFLQNLPWLESLSITRSKLQDASFLTELSNLRKVDLRNNPLESLPDLRRSKNLKIVLTDKDLRWETK